ncbi:unnamed protein product [Leuciscus chuanchicus]
MDVALTPYPVISKSLLRVTVTDANDNIPKFDKSHYDGELPENSPVGHSVLQVKASGSDMGPKGEVTYKFFQALTVKQAPFVKGSVYHEEINMLKFNVQAKDNGPQSKSSNKALMTITVKDQNDIAPLIRILGIGLVKHEDDDIAKISENMPEGTAVALVDVSDRDGDENAVVTCVVARDVSFQLQDE